MTVHVDPDQPPGEGFALARQLVTAAAHVRDDPELYQDTLNSVVEELWADPALTVETLSNTALLAPQAIASYVQATPYESVDQVLQAWMGENERRNPPESR